MSKFQPRCYYDDKKNFQFVVQIKDKYFTNKIVKKSFCYRHGYLHTREEAEEFAATCAKHLKISRDLRCKPLKEYLNKMTFDDKSWD